MNTHYCRVGTIRPNERGTIISKKSEQNSDKTETKTIRYKSKLSK
jgi:hypothetical protein